MKFVNFISNWSQKPKLLHLKSIQKHSITGYLKNGNMKIIHFEQFKEIKQ